MSARLPVSGRREGGRLWGRVALAAVVALALGVGSAYWAVRSGLAGGEVANGPWRTSLVTGSKDAGLYARVRVAVGGLLALAPSETIYFTAATDSAGDLLESGCDYVVEGGDLPARWWSVTEYAADHYLVPNDAGRYSFGSTTLAREPGGAWTMRLSRDPQEGNWLPTAREDGTFTLTIRLYNPAPSVYEEPATVALPRISKEGCR